MIDHDDHADEDHSHEDHDHPHVHAHPHDHPHDHPHGPEGDTAAAPGRPSVAAGVSVTRAVNHMQGATNEGTVMADIGGDRGALVLYTPPELAGEEIEISPLGSSTRTHVYVRERRMGDSRVFAAFYPSLPAGEHTVWNLASEPASTVTIIGGEVATLDWRTSA